MWFAVLIKALWELPRLGIDVGVLLLITTKVTQHSFTGTGIPKIYKKKDLLESQKAGKFSA
jgi:hypothetical protein